jgi:hypothetical protein
MERLSILLNFAPASLPGIPHQSARRFMALPSGIHDPFMSEFLASVSGTQRPSDALNEY